MVKIPIRGSAVLLTAVAIVAVTLIWLPAYRLFLAISIGIGVVVAGITLSMAQVASGAGRRRGEQTAAGTELACGIDPRGGVGAGPREKIQPTTLAVLQ
jgi:hypothetical protein